MGGQKSPLPLFPSVRILFLFFRVCLYVSVHNEKAYKETKIIKSQK